jgi:hypothetical protein
LKNAHIADDAEISFVGCSAKGAHFAPPGHEWPPPRIVTTSTAVFSRQGA